MGFLTTTACFVALEGAFAAYVSLATKKERRSCVMGDARARASEREREWFSARMIIETTPSVSEVRANRLTTI